MILKSYEIQRNPSNFLKYNFFLLYGENYGLKKEIQNSIKILLDKQENSTELLSLYENEIISNEENFYNSIYSGSLFSNKKIITIFDATDKIMKKIDNFYDSCKENIFLVLVSLGVALSKLKVFSFKETLIYSLIRILVGPIIGFAFVKYFNLTGVEAGVMFIQASMPSAVLTYLVGKIYSPKKISDSIASTTALSTFLSFFTLVIVVFLALKYFN